MSTTGLKGNKGSSTTNGGAANVIASSNHLNLLKAEGFTPGVRLLRMKENYVKPTKQTALSRNNSAIPAPHQAASSCNSGPVQQHLLRSSSDGPEGLKSTSRTPPLSGVEQSLSRSTSGARKGTHYQASTAGSEMGGGRGGGRVNVTTSSCTASGQGQGHHQKQHQWTRSDFKADHRMLSSGPPAPARAGANNAAGTTRPGSDRDSAGSPFVAIPMEDADEQKVNNYGASSCAAWSPAAARRLHLDQHINELGLEEEEAVGVGAADEDNYDISGKTVFSDEAEDQDRRAVISEDIKNGVEDYHYDLEDHFEESIDNAHYSEPSDGREDVENDGDVLDEGAATEQDEEMLQHLHGQHHHQQEDGEEPTSGAAAGEEDEENEVVEEESEDEFAMPEEHLNIHRVHRPLSRLSLDFFHTMIDQPTWRLLLIIAAAYFVHYFAFAVLYLGVDYGGSCELGFGAPIDAFYLSIETSATIGFGAQDQYFHHCSLMWAVLAVQMLISILLDSLVIGMVFTRLARGKQRAATVLFSKKACIIQTRRGELYFLVQIGELRQAQLQNCSVKAYIFKQGSDGEMITDLLRLQNPDDTLPMNLWLAMPNVIIHRIDAWSPFLPPLDKEALGGGIHNSQQLVQLPKTELYRRRALSACSDRGNNNHNHAARSVYGGGGGEEAFFRRRLRLQKLHGHGKIVDANTMEQWRDAHLSKKKKKAAEQRLEMVTTTSAQQQVSFLGMDARKDQDFFKAMGTPYTTSTTTNMATLKPPGPARLGGGVPSAKSINVRAAAAQSSSTTAEIRAEQPPATSSVPQALVDQCERHGWACRIPWAGSLRERVFDAEHGSRVGFVCSVCGQGFASRDSLLRHCLYVIEKNYRAAEVEAGSHLQEEVPAVGGPRNASAPSSGSCLPTAEEGNTTRLRMQPRAQLPSTSVAVAMQSQMSRGGSGGGAVTTTMNGEGAGGGNGMLDLHASRQAEFRQIKERCIGGLEVDGGHQALLDQLLQHQQSKMRGSPLLLIPENASTDPNSLYQRQKAAEHVSMIKKSLGRLPPLSGLASNSFSSPAVWGGENSGGPTTSVEVMKMKPKSKTSSKALLHDIRKTTHLDQKPTMKKPALRKILESYLADSWFEVLVVIDGNEPSTGHAVEARSSYLYSDITWDHIFAPCVLPFDRSLTEVTGGAGAMDHSTDQIAAVIDFKKFHKLVPFDGRAQQVRLQSYL
eukprot:g8025.t1